MSPEMPPAEVSPELAAAMAALSKVPMTEKRAAAVAPAIADFADGFEAIRRIPVPDAIEGLAPYTPVK